ncbi:unnamed protein product [Brassica rapa]|uniref:F-box domain-containing protein n=1 Tax=Brassica campestris TaxID=3711 RepID=A0A8D9GTJ1_BRACM|nr:unnamed protein product [Brassica rapa]
MISQEVDSTEKKTIPEPPSISFSSLPHEIAENILARVSRWKYPRLSLVSKSFRSLLSSMEIYKTRSQIGVQETCVYICLELPNQCASWFSLWTKPNIKQTKRRGKIRFKRDSSGNSVVPSPFSSSHSPPLPYNCPQTVGSKIYIIGGPDKKPSSSVRILDCKSHTWHDGPNMTVARECASTLLLGEKIYVLGGCNIDVYSTNLFEVFDIRTQSWTALTGPRSGEDDEVSHTCCSIVNVFEGKIYAAENLKDYAYEPKHGTWKLVREKSRFLPRSFKVMFWCEMENVLYLCTDLGYLLWYGSEIEDREWREIKGLDKLRKHLKTGMGVEMVNYGGMLLVMWHSYPYHCIRNKIWYAKICLESRCSGREMWGKLLLAVKQCHEKGICHGDIKCENVLVTSWNWLYLADFASFKPTYIPYDDPSDFSFFYDTRGQRLCYLAPERFYEHGGETKVAQDAPLKPSMDIFAVGCVIAELFLEGQPLFELAQLLAYRRGQHDPSQHLEKIPDPGIRKMILHMIQLEPEARLSAENYLQNYVATCQGIFQEILKKMMENKPGDEMGVDSPLPSHPVNASKVQETFLSHRQYLEISREVKPTEKKTIPEPPSISFSSLPHEIAENILARVSRWKYPRLSLVSKSFRSLLSSTEIYKTRSQIGANETCVYICLELPDQPCARWFSLWTNPDKTRTKRIGTKTRFKRDSSGNSVLQIPFSSSPSAPLPYDTQTVGSEIYIIGGPHKKPSSSVRILDCKSQTWCDAPNMTVARENAATALVDDKIYVVGGCDIDAYSTNWVEVFDIRSQSWTALPGPGSLVDDELPDDDDYCNIVNVFEGKIYLTIDEKDYIYDSKDDTWKLVRVETSFLSSVKVWWEMENVLYCCTDLGYLMWSGCEIEGREWREIKGLNKLRKHLKTGNEIEMVKYGAKLLVMWHSYPDLCMGNKIWYAKICLESRCNGGEV